MTSRRERASRCLLAAVVLAALAAAIHIGCDGNGGEDGGASDGAADVSAADGRGDGDGPGSDALVDSGEAPDPGPLTLIASDFSLSTERVCDLDGDGLPDNAVADLGEPGATILGGALDAAIEAAADESGARLLMHLPWVDDRAGPTAPASRLIFVYAVDAAFPPDPDDDFDGSERFRADRGALDPCGEPTAVVGSVVLDRGRLSGERGTFVLYGVATLEGVQVEGTVAAGGADGSATLCGGLTIREAASRNTEIGQGLTFLEVLIGGGASLGLGGVPGMEPDLDLDGDGLERLEVDGDNRVTACVDGDATVIPGRDCTGDPRMADAFALVMDLELVGASLEGIGAGFWGNEPGGCPDGPPSPSAWGPCPSPETAQCERGETRGCEPACGERGRARCSWGCDGWDRCQAEGRLSLAPASCDEVLVGGDAACSVADGAVSLATETGQAGFLALPEEITVGTGLTVVEVSVASGPGTTAEPGGSWALALWLDGAGPPAPGGASFGGADPSRRGYFLEWELWVDRGAGPLADDGIRLAHLDGAGAEEALCEGYWTSEIGVPHYCTSYTEARLDADATAAVRQEVSVAVVPDDPATEEDETLLAYRWHKPDGALAMLVACSGGRCPETIAPGQRVTIALSAAAESGRDATFEAPLPGGLTILVEGPCP